MCIRDRLAFVAFIVMHTFMVVVTGFSRNMGDIILGQHQTDQGAAVLIGLALIASILAIYAVTSWSSRRWPRTAQHVLGRIIRPIMRALAVRTRSRQHYPASSISPQFLVNGEPPDSSEYAHLMADGFTDWRLEGGERQAERRLHQPA